MKTCHCGKPVKTSGLCWGHWLERREQKNPAEFAEWKLKQQAKRKTKHLNWRSKPENRAKAVITRRLPEKRFKQAALRSRHRKLEWTLNFETWMTLIDIGCFYCLKDIRQEAGCGLDRLDNSEGYTMFNVVPCCGNCNKMRNDFVTSKEFLVMSKALMKHRGINPDERVSEIFGRPKWKSV